MANTKSAIKRIRTSEKRHQRNQAVKSATRTYVKKARTAIVRNAGEAHGDIIAAISALDKAAKKGVIHPNNAGRRKSRLMKRYNAALPSAVVPAPDVVAEEPAPKKTRAKSTTKSGVTKSAAAKTTPAKKAAVKTPATKAPAEKTSTKKSPAAKSTTTRTRTKKTDS